MKAELIPEDGSPPIRIERDVTVVGRREYCDVRIDHPSLSKRHAVLVMTEGLLILRDLASTNGTKVKGQRIRWAALLPDDRISFGTQKFRVYLGPDDVPAPSERTRPAARTPNSRPVTFAEPSPLGIPVVAVSGMLRDDTHGSDDWRNAMKQPVPNGSHTGSKGLNDHELLIEDDMLEVVDDDDEIIDLH